MMSSLWTPTPCSEFEARASLERRKIYVALRDAAAERNGLLRVVDESGDTSTRASDSSPSSCRVGCSRRWQQRGEPWPFRDRGAAVMIAGSLRRAAASSVRRCIDYEAASLHIDPVPEAPSLQFEEHAACG